MAKPEDSQRFSLVEAAGLTVYVERHLNEAGEPIEFLIPHVGNFVLEPAHEEGPGCHGEAGRKPEDEPGSTSSS